MNSVRYIGMDGVRVSRGTVCSLGQPNKAIGLESQIEPWLAIATTLLAGAKKPHGTTQNSMGSALSDGRGHCESRSGTESCRCMRGLDVRKLLPRQRREKCSLLTSPFIEPASATNQLSSFCSAHCLPQLC